MCMGVASRDAVWKKSLGAFYVAETQKHNSCWFTLILCISLHSFRASSYVLQWHTTSIKLLVILRTTIKLAALVAKLQLLLWYADLLYNSIGLVNKWIQYFKNNYCTRKIFATLKSGHKYTSICKNSIKIYLKIKRYLKQRVAGGKLCITFRGWHTNKISEFIFIEGKTLVMM